MSTSLRTLCSYTLLSTIVLSGEYWTPFFSPCAHRPYSLLLEALQNSAWGLRYPLRHWQSENQFNWKNQRWRSIIKIKLQFFWPCARHPCSFLLVDLWEWERRCQIQHGGWDIHCGMDIAEVLIEKIRGEEVKSRPPFFSYLALDIPVTVCCWLCGNESGGAKFSLRAEISTVVWT